MDNNDFLLLVCKKLSGDATITEIKELEMLLAENRVLAKQYKILQQFWDEHESPNELFVEDALQKTLNRLNLPTNNPIKEEAQIHNIPAIYNINRRIAVAVSVLLLIGSGIFLATQTGNKKGTRAPVTALEKKHNSKGIKSTIELADGSKVWLNADSRIEYPESFSGNTREVYLNGEAFFEVAKNPARPFIIHLANGTVKVVGTSFNIRAYDNEKLIETSVATGKVAFIPKYKMNSQKRDTFFLLANNKVRYVFNDEKIVVLPTVAKDDKAWTEGRLIFKAMSLQDIAIELERNFGKRVNFMDSEAQEYILTGSFQNNTLEEIMFYLSLSKTKKFYYKITNDELLIATKAGMF